MEFVTSDLHLDHDNVIAYCDRPYKDIVEMRTNIIAEINALPDGAVLYILGDFTVGSKKAKLRQILDDVKKTIKLIFVLGNHDHRLADVFKEYGEVHYLLEIKYNDVKVVMCHFPMYEWNRGQHGSIHMHGHTHGNFKAPGKIVDVGWDCYKRILTLQEAFELADRHPIYQPCHNKNNGLHRHEIS